MLQADADDEGVIEKDGEREVFPESLELADSLAEADAEALPILLSEELTLWDTMPLGESVGDPEALRELEGEREEEGDPEAHDETEGERVALRDVVAELVSELLELSVADGDMVPVTVSVTVSVADAEGDKVVERVALSDAVGVTDAQLLKDGEREELELREGEPDEQEDAVAVSLVLLAYNNARYLGSVPTAVGIGTAMAVTVGGLILVWGSGG